MDNIEPDVVGIAGHQFHVNYGVPKRVTERLLELVDQDEDVEYEDTPADLKAYEMRDEYVEYGAEAGDGKG